VLTIRNLHRIMTLLKKIPHSHYPQDTLGISIFFIGEFPTWSS